MAVVLHAALAFALLVHVAHTARAAAGSPMGYATLRDAVHSLPQLSAFARMADASGPSVRDLLMDTAAAVRTPGPCCLSVLQIKTLVSADLSCFL
jgi:hypothetical protein